MRYDHIQKAPLFLLLVATSLGMLFGGFAMPDPISQTTMFAAAAVVALLSFSFMHLRVSDGGDALLVSFGPLPLFRRQVAYDAIQRVEKTRSTLLDGWGIHLSLSGGWVWNLWGFDCVDIHYGNGQKLRLGTDDPVQLESFLRQQCRRPQA